MSGLEVLGAASAIVSLIEAASKAVDFVQAVKDADQEALEFSSRARTIRYLLQELHSKLNKQAPSNGRENEWKAEIERLNPVFTRLEAAFNEFSNHLQGQLGWGGKLRWPTHRKKAEAILAQIDSLQQCLQTALTGDILELSSSISVTLENLSGYIRQLSSRVQQMHLGIEKVHDTSKALKAFIASQAQTAVIKSLVPDEIMMDSRECGEWHPSSGEWLKRSKEYQDWYSIKGARLWWSGVAGAGKTVLATIVVHDLSARYAQDNQTQVLKIYFDDSRERSRTDCLGSLWRQLASRRHFSDEEIALLDKRYVEQRILPDQAKWKEMIADEAQHYTKIFLILDALDEFADRHPMKFVEDLVSLLPWANTLITSRPDLPIRNAYRLIKAEALRIEAHKVDLQEYVHSRITGSANMDLVVQAPELGELIKDRVLKSSQGM